jgi:hypothetical protein
VVRSSLTCCCFRAKLQFTGAHDCASTYIAGSMPLTFTLTRSGTIIIHGTSLLVLCFMLTVACIMSSFLTVCAPGFVETASGNCARCPIGCYCPGGTGNGQSSSLSVGATPPLVQSTENVTSGLRSFQISCGWGRRGRLCLRLSNLRTSRAPNTSL